eukprot:4033241-Amphidinium_carterae.1
MACTSLSRLLCSGKGCNDCKAMHTFASSWTLASSPELLIRNLQPSTEYLQPRTEYRREISDRFDFKTIEFWHAIGTNSLRMGVRKSRRVRA